MSFNYFLQQSIIGIFSQKTRFVQKRKQTGLLFIKIENWLIVVIDQVAQEFFQSVVDENFFFIFENVGNIQLLKMFIRIIDAQLFETIYFEILESENIQ